jgi:hypothetical protein
MHAQRGHHGQHHGSSEGKRGSSGRKTGAKGHFRLLGLEVGILAGSWPGKEKVRWRQNGGAGTSYRGQSAAETDDYLTITRVSGKPEKNRS